MLFNSFEFLIFLPIIFVGYWFIFRRLRLQNLFIVISSYVFYGWWDSRFLFLIFCTTLLCFSTAILIERANSRNAKKWICAINAVCNLCILCYFKYFNFFSSNLQLLFQQFGYQLDWFTLDILLPVGISFYTFQAISYPIDVSRGKIAVTHDFISFAAYISFFPQLVAGPIERSTNLLPQILRPRQFSYDTAVDGMRQILWGFFKKIVIADNCAMFANIIFDNYRECNSISLWLGAFLFSFQIYNDFSGYSDIAIGVAKLFGIHLQRNFHYPYFSKSISEFWRRWHISLNTWFRDYVYIPLGGSRCSVLKTIRNIMIVFLLSGLWHGADWTFILWGTYYGLLFIPSILSRHLKQPESTAGKHSADIRRIRGVLSTATTFFIVMIGWIMFRADSVSEGIQYMARCFSPSLFDMQLSACISGNNTKLTMTLVMIAAMLIIDFTQREKDFGLEICNGRPIYVRWGIYLTIIFSILIFTGEQTQFIYFQF